MGHQSVAFTQPKTRKANHEHDENRDTEYPKIVTRPESCYLQDMPLKFLLFEKTLENKSCIESPKTMA